MTENSAIRPGLRYATLSAALLLLAGAAPAFSAVRAAASCPDCERWNEPVAPFRIHANTWYVGTRNLASILVTSDFGHVLIDGGLPQSAAQIAANIETLGFKVADVKAILNSHAHFDHAGGLAELQRLSGAPVYVRRPAADVLRAGKLASDDPQARSKSPAIPAVGKVWIVSDDQLLGVGSIRLRAIATPGHTPGGTTWTWESCDGDKCLNFVYADSLAPVSSEGFRFSEAADGQVAAATALEASIARVEQLRCDVLVTPHPEASQFHERIAKRPADDTMALKDGTLCRKLAQDSRERLAARLAEEARKGAGGR